MVTWWSPSVSSVSISVFKVETTGTMKDGDETRLSKGLDGKHKPIYYTPKLTMATTPWK